MAWAELSDFKKEYHFFIDYYRMVLKFQYYYNCVVQHYCFLLTAEARMPTYDYKCTNCGHRFEVFQSMKDDPIKECEKCGGQVKRLIGAGAGIIFKGSGFYVNDYKNNGKNSKEASNGSSAPAPACASCPSSDSCSVDSK